jgi:hypothetical protein
MTLSSPMPRRPSRSASQPPRKISGRRRDGVDEEAGCHPGAVEPGNVAEPWPGPEGEHGDTAAAADPDQRREAPDHGIGEHPPEPVELGAQALRRRGGRPFRHGDQVERGARHRDRGKHDERHAPADEADHHLGRPGGDEETELAAAHDDGIAERMPAGRQREGHRFEAAHQRAAESGADQRAGERQGQGVLAEGKGERAHGGASEQHRLDPARTVAVEGNADRQLRGAVGDEERRGQEPQRGGVEADVGDEVGRDQRVDGAEDVGQNVAERESGEDDGGRSHGSSIQGPGANDCIL